MKILGYTLVMTCGACPEQYDVFSDEDQKNLVGYLRLRHGNFTASYVGGNSRNLVYQANPRGDGIFDNDMEREYYLTKAIENLDYHIKGKGYYQSSYDLI